jgi:ATP-dependent exoDNAse (exonuclease V) beta subunit
MINVNELQEQASNPNHSVWVTASAGSGKTKVLIDRLLRLLLSGKHPSSIVCMTFSQNGAREIEQRLDSILKQWIFLTDADLQNELNKLGMYKISKARSLWSKVLDHPIQICTIHSFCNTLLNKYSLEYKVRNFELLTESIEKKLIHNTLNRIFLKIKPPTIKKYEFDSIIQFLLDHKSTLRMFLVDSDLLKQRIKASLDNPRNINDIDTSLITHFPVNTALQLDLSDKEREFLELWKKSGSIEESIALFRIKDGSIRKKILNKKTDEELEKKGISFSKTYDLIVSLNNELLNKSCLDHTLYVLEIAEIFLTEYQLEKKKHNYIDYDDLILDTIKLLSDLPETAAYTLHTQTQHLLIDEAQDTNIFQWKIIEYIALAEDKTLFVVGDPKQSIFSFQGSDPLIFQTMKTYFSNKLPHLKDLIMNVSFRSNSEILDFVDSVFETRMPNYSNHTSFIGKGGSVIVHPEPQEFSWEDIVDQIIDTNDVFVLIRKRGEYLKELMEALDKKRISYKTPSQNLVSEDPLLQKIGFSIAAYFQPLDPYAEYKKTDTLNFYNSHSYMHLIMSHLQEFLSTSVLGVHQFFEKTTLRSCSALYNQIRQSDLVYHPVSKDEDISLNIMTAHASKGLQASTVCLIDTVTLPRNRSSRFILDKEQQLVFIVPDKPSLEIKEFQEHQRLLVLEEYERLLYVALTRAKTNLHVFYSPMQKNAEGSWYNLCSIPAHEYILC